MNLRTPCTWNRELLSSLSLRDPVLWEGYLGPGHCLSSCLSPRATVTVIRLCKVTLGSIQPARLNQAAQRNGGGGKGPWGCQRGWCQAWVNDQVGGWGPDGTGKGQVGRGTEEVAGQEAPNSGGNRQVTGPELSRQGQDVSTGGVGPGEAGVLGICRMSQAKGVGVTRMLGKMRRGPPGPGGPG